MWKENILSKPSKCFASLKNFFLNSWKSKFDQNPSIFMAMAQRRPLFATLRLFHVFGKQTWSRFFLLKIKARPFGALKLIDFLVWVVPRNSGNVAILVDSFATHQRGCRPNLLVSLRPGIGYSQTNKGIWPMWDTEQAQHLQWRCKSYSRPWSFEIKKVFQSSRLSEC